MNFSVYDLRKLCLQAFCSPPKRFEMSNSSSANKISQKKSVDEAAQETKSMCAHLQQVTHETKSLLQRIAQAQQECDDLQKQDLECTLKSAEIKQELKQVRDKRDELHAMVRELKQVNSRMQEQVDAAQAVIIKQ